MMKADILSNKIKDISFPAVCETPVSWGDLNIQRADDYKAIVNPETGKVFAIASKDYRLIRHEDAITQIEKAISKSPELGKYEFTTEFYNDGGRMRRTYRFIEKKVEIIKGDVINPQVHMFNSYDTTWPLIVILGALRVVCSNGLVVGKKFLHLRKRHVYDFNQIDIQEEVASAMERFKFQSKQWSRWADRRLTEGNYQKVIDTMKFGQEALEQIYKRIEAEAEIIQNGFPILNLWAFYNVLTWYITHRAVSLNHRVEMERKLRKAFGQFR